MRQKHKQKNKAIVTPLGALVCHVHVPQRSRHWLFMRDEPFRTQPPPCKRDKGLESALQFYKSNRSLPRGQRWSKIQTLRSRTTALDAFLKGVASQDALADSEHRPGCDIRGIA